VEARTHFKKRGGTESLISREINKNNIIMKTISKISLGFSIFLLMIFFTGLSSCSKHGDPASGNPLILSGTVWVNADNINQELTTITFLSESSFRMDYKDLSDGYTDSGIGTYVFFDPPSITLHLNGDTDSGTISGNKMTLNTLGVFTKK